MIKKNIDGTYVQNQWMKLGDTRVQNYKIKKNKKIKVHFLLKIQNFHKISKLSKISYDLKKYRYSKW
jgi:hypothetical protein